MNIFIIPSWSPSEAFPLTGIFFEEQARAYAHMYPKDRIALSRWGSHDPDLWLDKAQWSRILHKVFFPPKKKAQQWWPLPTFVIYEKPARTWTRRIFNGNMKRIIQANAQNLARFKATVGDVDIIHAHVSFPAGYIALALSRKYGIPYVLTEHMEPFPFQSLRNFFGKPMIEIVQAMQQASANIAVSRGYAAEINEIIPTDFHIIPNYVDETFFFPLTSEKSYRILFIGRNCPQKGIDVLLEAWRMLGKKRGRYELYMIGPEIEKLSVQYENDLTESVVIVGERNRAQTVSELQRCDFLVLPSQKEPFGIVMAEAIACGKPIVATKSAGALDVVSPINGLLADVGDPEDLADKLEQMILTYDQYDAIKIRADFLERFSAHAVLPRLRKIYTDVITNDSARFYGLSR